MTRVVANITEKGQVTIPAEIRRHLGVSKPGRVEFVINSEGNVQVQRIKYTLEDLFGSIPALPGRTSDDFEEEIHEAFEAGIARMLGEDSDE